jgi:alkanesulfonate monooxygenase SsuD/methylene tetrahydromethanopterin reductase-like flavin-dependent oxidoreductase (luciferase family)
MDIGVVFPQTDIGNDPHGIRDHAQAVEAMGFTHILAYDHVLGANRERHRDLTGPYSHRDAFHEPFVLFGYLAGATRRLGFATGIVILPQRQTALVAKQAAAIPPPSASRVA